jgi:ElaB/YqjD/DUF883 family membrane-anchored ribosome-binding protein
MTSTAGELETLRSRIDQLASGIVDCLDDLPARTKTARRHMKGWGGRAGAFVKERPGMAMVGAFAIGFLLAKVARHA